ncbi:putative quinol monooxygenase [Lutimaribacter saemankumensis]|uniref:Quinol monooxygenase YgiN n=1 Tax=Lutimaribacter saemankumensis TaxID=490829 RepID=A0A1G8GEW1_9RHOB|nr:antibiotic biosynthesis monooxygenase [Lutimaribacter saemankumensis]SDH92886.1 Quinol monooxygenase YgiN [Lutimaribacter saemankumensis]
MFTLTAILRAKPGHEDKVKAALLKVGAFAREQEPDTAGFFVSQSAEDARVFVTHERFADQAAMDRHNQGAGSKGFFAEAGDLLDGPVTVVTGPEIFEK